MSYDPSTTYTKEMGSKLLRAAGKEKAILQSDRTTKPSAFGTGDELVAYLNFDIWADTWEQRKKTAPAITPATESTTDTELQYSLLDIPAVAPAFVEEPEQVAIDSDLGDEWFPDALPVEADHSETPMSELKKLVAIKADSEGQPMSKVGNDNRTLDGWTPTMLIEYLGKTPSTKPPAVNPPLPGNDVLPPLVNIPLPVTMVSTNAVNPPLPVVKLKQHKGMMPNGRNAKGTPSFDKWFGRSYPSNVAYPAWKYLTKTSTDVANICIAKHDHAGSCNKKDSSGVPWFEFSFKEAVAAFKISRPTFDKSIKQLVEIGFIKYVVRDGIPQRGNFVDGRGTPAQYQLSQDWRTLSQDDIKKLVALSQKQNPSKPVFTSTSKPAFTSEAE